MFGILIKKFDVCNYIKRFYQLVIQNFNFQRDDCLFLKTVTNN